MYCKQIYIQLFDDSDTDYRGGVYRVTRSEHVDFLEEEFHKAWEKAVEITKAKHSLDWSENDILANLSNDGWWISSVEVTNVSY